MMIKPFKKNMILLKSKKSYYSIQNLTVLIKTNIKNKLKENKNAK